MLRAGIIGLGKMGISHAAIIGANPLVDLVAVCASAGKLMQASMKKRMSVRLSRELRFIFFSFKVSRDGLLYVLDVQLSCG